MIVARIFEGLGNQLFQYAMGRAMAEHFNVPLKLDLGFFKTDQLREDQHDSPKRAYGLGAFHIEAQVIGRLERAFYPTSRGSTLSRLFDKCVRLGGSSIPPQIKGGVHYDQSKIDQIGPDCYLNGYWHSERYFSPVADKIRSEFRLRSTPEVLQAHAQAAAWRKEAGGRPLVAVHVRRGDLIPIKPDGGIRKKYGPPTSAAFVQAGMREFDGDSQFVIVTDFKDREWCQRNIRGDHIHYYDGPSAIADFAVLQSCDHNVVANSTFSWWAAWLNSNPDKQVVAPSVWFWPEGAEWQKSDDLLPPKWKTLDVFEDEFGILEKNHQAKAQTVHGQPHGTVNTAMPAPQINSPN